MELPLLLKTLKGENTPRPPVWYMRQAGRVLPSYLALKEKYSFWHMMKEPRLAARVTLLPVEELDVDAAILFSDILVIPWAMGMGLDFTDNGPVFEAPLYKSANPLEVLRPDGSKLNYIYKAIDEIIKVKPDHIPLIGFCGGPLTVLSYMLEGLGSKNGFPETTRFIYQNKHATLKLVRAIEELSVEYLRGQAKHGISVFQLFETHAGLIPFGLYEQLFMPAVKKLASVARDLNMPFIYFPKDAGIGIKRITPEMCDFLSIDWQTPLDLARQLVHPEIGLQGNIDPRALYADKAEIEKMLNEYLEFGRENPNWIINLGHGFKPGIPYENIKFMTAWFRQADWKRS